MNLRIIVELAKDKSQGENGNKQNREKNKETCDFVHANPKQFAK